MKNLLVGQSGGPTSVINASLAGVIQNGIKSPEIGKVLGTVNGIEGILSENIISLDHFTDQDITLLKQTPSSYLGSCRKKLPDASDDEAIYKKIFEVFKKNDIGYFFYIGGNDSMDTAKKLSSYATEKGIDGIKIIGVPKTIDNDLVLTDHTPGFGSCAKFVANSIRQLYLDTSVYKMKSIVIVEIMGRNAGWLAATAALANADDIHPVDILCLPEVVFDVDKFVDKVSEVMKTKDTTIIAISEGIKDETGRYIGERKDLGTGADGFSHAALGGAGRIVEHLLQSKLPEKIKTRTIEFSTLQRCFSATASKVDVDEAFSAGFMAVEFAKEGMTAVMPGFKRLSSNPYKMEIVPFDVKDVANYEKEIPKDMLSSDGFGVTEKFIEYAKPLIEGENPIIYKDGLIQFKTR